MDQFRSPQFRELQRRWYLRLREEGFCDIEEAGSREYLKAWEAHYFQSNYTPASFLAKEEYFIKATQFLGHYCFRYKEDKEIWKLHAEGKTLRDIQKTIFYPAPWPRFIRLSRVRTTITRLKLNMLKTRL